MVAEEYAPSLNLYGYFPNRVTPLQKKGHTFWETPMWSLTFRIGVGSRRPAELSVWLLTDMLHGLGQNLDMAGWPKEENRV